MKKFVIASAILSALAVTGTANAYQAEIGASGSWIDPDNGSADGQYGVNGTYYFKPVQTRNSPLAEAAFLDRASNVDAFYSYNQVESNFQDIENHRYGAGVEVYIPNSNFYVSGELSRHTQDIDTVLGNYDRNVTYYGAEVGYLPTPGLLVAVGLKGYDLEDDRLNDEDGVDPTLRAKYVTTLANGKDINLEAGAAFGDLDEYNVKADYYFDKTFSAGVDYYNNDLTDNDEFGINARKFFTPQFSLEGRVGFGEVGNNDYNRYGVAAKYRF